jgi:methylenetetrahydrofolate reductase (NADPH)
LNYKSYLEEAFSKNQFVITCEIGPPKGSDPSIIEKKAKMLKGYADAFNITDNQTAVVRMSSFAGCNILLKMTMEPIMQITCRDRNRIALQSDVLGAFALGIKNILCLTGDHQSFGNHPGTKGVFDLDSIQLIQILKNMRDKGIFQNGEKINAGPPKIFIGAATNPFSSSLKLRIDRLQKKINAGVDFIQTQSVYNIEKFKNWMDEVNSRGLDNKVFILAGVTPLKSLKMAERMKFHVPGVDIPDEMFYRIEDARDPKKEGFKIALDIIKELKKIKGIHGIHITALFWEDIIPSLIKEADIRSI